MSQQQKTLHAYGFPSNSSSGQYPHGGMYQESPFSSAPVSYAGLDDRNRVAQHKGRRRDTVRDSIYVSNNEHDISIDCNRGPRASKLKVKNTSELGFSSISRNDASLYGIHSDLYNRSDFVTDYDTAKFYVIKSFSEDNIQKSIKYRVWASTPHGNKKFDAAYNEAKNNNGNCPVFLLFSVNGSGQFCGVAEMIGAVDFEKDADYWQQDRWSGQFPVKWHLIKDVPNSQFRHILLENNDNKPVTHSRDSQEVKLEHGVEMLKVFKGYVSRTSIFDDFEFYDERERALKERKARQRASFLKDTQNTLAAINEMSNSFAQALQFEGGR